MFVSQENPNKYILPKFIYSFYQEDRETSWQRGEESAFNAGNLGAIPGSERSPGEGNGNPLHGHSGKFHGQRSLASYSPWGHKDSDMTELLTLTDQEDNDDDEHSSN